MNEYTTLAVAARTLWLADMELISARISNENMKNCERLGNVSGANYHRGCLYSFASNARDYRDMALRDLRGAGRHEYRQAVQRWTP